MSSSRIPDSKETSQSKSTSKASAESLAVLLTLRNYDSDDVILLANILRQNHIQFQSVNMDVLTVEPPVLVKLDLHYFKLVHSMSVREANGVYSMKLKKAVPDTNNYTVIKVDVEPSWNSTERWERLTARFINQNQPIVCNYPAGITPAQLRRMENERFWLAIGALNKEWSRDDIYFLITDRFDVKIRKLDYANTYRWVRDRQTNRSRLHQNIGIVFVRFHSQEDRDRVLNQGRVRLSTFGLSGSIDIKQRNLPNN